MSVDSMTGFARSEGRYGEFGWVWEVKSVNGRALDIRSRLPNGFDALEAQVKPAVAARFRRGSIQISLTQTVSARPPRLRLNREVLDAVVELIEEISGRVAAEPPRLDGLLGIRGVVETVEDEETAEQHEEREAAMRRSLDEALDGLAVMRREEGQRLGGMLADHLARIEDLSGAASDCATAQPGAIRARFMERVTGLLEGMPSLSEERLAQEVALLAAKADIREELDRLKAHVAAARDLLKEDEAVGRRLDFLCQEFNREANTLCSKSADVALTRIGLDLKAAVEQLREQVQNVE